MSLFSKRSPTKTARAETSFGEVKIEVSGVKSMLRKATYSVLVELPIYKLKDPEIFPDRLCQHFGGKYNDVWAQVHISDASIVQQSRKNILSVLDDVAKKIKDKF